MSVTSRDVAREAGVSQATVSRVMTAGAAVSDSTRMRVLSAMERIGYVPNRPAQVMKTGRTGTVGVVVADLGNPFYPQLLEALTRSFDNVGRRVAVWVSDGGKNRAALDSIREGSVDGVIFTTVTQQSVELARALERQSAIVLVNRTVDGLDCDQVSSDNIRGSAIVAEYLIQHRRTRIAFIGGDPDASTTRERSDGLSHQLQALAPQLGAVHSAVGRYTYRSGFDLTSSVLARDSSIDTLVCGNDLLAFAAMDAARAAGRRVPQDVWVIGYDDIEMSSWGSFDLTTVRQDVEELAARATRLLIARIENPQRQPERELLAPELVVRGSTGSAPGASPLAHAHN